MLLGMYIQCVFVSTAMLGRTMERIPWVKQGSMCARSICQNLDIPK